MGAAALVVLAACSSSGYKSSSSTTPTTRTGSAVTATSTPNAQPFTLEPGFEHDVCGIGISVKFIPATATSATADEPVLMGGPISNIQDDVQDHTGDQPLPANAANAVAGSTATVYGKQFKVDNVDVAVTTVRLDPIC